MRTLTALLSLIFTLGGAGLAHADCGPRPLFSSVEQADRIVVGRVGQSRNTSGETVRVIRVLKGTMPSPTFSFFGNPFTSLVEAGHRYLFILDAQGASIRCRIRDLAHQPRQNRAIVRAIPAYLGASASERARLLVDWASSGGELGTEAALWLAYNPEMARLITDAESARLLDRLRAAEPGDEANALGYALARAHYLPAVPMLIEKSNAPGYNARPALDALELLTNHHDAGYRRGHDVHGDELAAIQARWRTWYASYSSSTAANVLTEGYRERGLTPPADRGAQRQIVIHGPDELSRSVALASCERTAHDHPFLRDYLSSPLRAEEWTSLANARCSRP